MPSGNLFFSIASFLLLLVFGNASSANEAEDADAIYHNGSIYTVDAYASTVTAVAIKDGRFLAVGDDADIMRYRGSDTAVHNLRGRMVLPGIVDAHVHPVRGGLAARNYCRFDPDAALEKLLDSIKRCAKERKPGEWVEGAQWNTLLAGQLHRSMLDEVAPDNPVYLHDVSNHLIWVNSQALKLAGIDRNTPQPAHGYILRDPANGEPTGILGEAAVGQVFNAMPKPQPEVVRQVARKVFGRLNRYGVTTIQAAQLNPMRVAAYRQLENEGELTVRIKGNWDFNTMLAPRPPAVMFSQFDERKERGAGSTLINPDGAKIYIDGVLIGHASPYLQPYRDEPTYGKQAIDQPSLNAAVTRMDAAGLSVMMHAMGDAAVRAALDAVEAARSANGSGGPRHVIAHSMSVHRDDYGRGRALNAVFEVSPPVILFPNALSLGGVHYLGRERVRHIAPVADLLKAGDVVAYGSDWDNIPEPNPWLALQTLVTRQNPHDPKMGALAPDQAINMRQAIEVLTYNGAYALGLEDSTGSIEVGKDADMIVLNQNLFEVPFRRIVQTKVLQTLLRGKVIYQD